MSTASGPDQADGAPGRSSVGKQPTKSAQQQAKRPTGRPAKQVRTKPQTAAEARAEMEASRAATKSEREARMNERFGDRVPGRSIIITSWVVTALFAAVTIPAIIDPDSFIVPFFVVSTAAFFLGCALFAVDIVLAAARSRDDAMGIGGLFFLAGSAPRSVQLNLLGSLVAQLVISIVGAAIHPFTPLAFGTLVPMVGLGFCGLWAVRHGLFPPRSS